MRKITALLILSLTLLFIVGCAAGATPLPTPTPAEAQAVEAQATDTPAPTATPEPLPPLVLRSSPEQGEEAPLDAVIEIAFDQPGRSGPQRLRPGLAFCICSDHLLMCRRACIPPIAKLK